MPAPDDRLRSLRYFTALARVGNFGRAARELSISQSALTQSMKVLEAGLGTDLLIRHSRGATLTRAGSRLLEILDVAIPMLSETLSDDEEPAHNHVVRLGVPSECASLVVPVFAEEFCRRWPNLQLDVRTGLDGEALLARRLDVAIVQDPPLVDELGIEPILDEELGLVCAPSSPAADDLSALHIRDLANLPLILPSDRHPVRRRLERLCHQHNVQLRPRFQVDSLRLRKALVRRWDATTILQRGAAHAELLRGSLTFRPLEPRLTLLTAIAFHRATASPSITLAVDALRTSMIGLIDSAAWPGITKVRRA